MPTSSKDPAHRVVFVALLVSNILLYATWPWLREMPLNSDSSEPFVMRNVLRNEAYLARFFAELRQNNKIFYLGTSESNVQYNIAAQLNYLSKDNPQMIALAKGGLSMIHSTLVIAKAKREGIEFPPMVLVINPVYFTQSHDVIDDGWLSDIVRSPVFLQVNHRDVLNHVSKDVREAYDQHFALRRALYPATLQEYLGNLLYLSFHQPNGAPTNTRPLPVPVYRFDARVPNYDKERNVWAGNQAVDRLDKSRWLINEIEKSVNLKGLDSIMGILRRETAPVLLLVLPVNRKFYVYHGLDMTEFDRRYQAIRDEIQDLAQGENTHIIDLYDAPKLHFGFRDRMHMDQYGFFQLSTHILKHEAYQRFVKAVKDYYSAVPSSTEIVPQ